MLEINKIRENKESIISLLKVRNKDFSQLIQDALTQDELRRNSQFTLDQELSEMNQLSKKIGELFKGGKQEEAILLKNKTVLLKESTKKLKEQLLSSEIAIREILCQIPNVPNAIVPAGNSDEQNEVIQTFGKEPKLFDGAVPHWELAKKYNLIDFELGVKITGAGFPVYTGKGAQLQRALINFFLNEAIINNYQEVIPPLLVNADSGYATGQLPDKEGQMYFMQEDQLYLIPTAEVILTNMVRETNIKKENTKKFNEEECQTEPMLIRRKTKGGITDNVKITKKCIINQDRKKTAFNKKVKFVIIGIGINLIKNPQIKNYPTTNILKETGVALLPGSDFGFDKNRMLARLSFTDFDGQNFMNKIQNHQKIDDSIIFKLAPKIVEGVNKLKKWSESI